MQLQSTRLVTVTNWVAVLVYMFWLQQVEPKEIDKVGKDVKCIANCETHDVCRTLCSHFVCTVDLHKCSVTS